MNLDRRHFLRNLGLIVPVVAVAPTLTSYFFAPKNGWFREEGKVIYTSYQVNMLIRTNDPKFNFSEMWDLGPVSKDSLKFIKQTATKTVVQESSRLHRLGQEPKFAQIEFTTL